MPWNEKQSYWLNYRPQMWPSALTLAMTLTLNFQGQIWNLLYLSQNWYDCHKMKRKHIDWTLGLKCNHGVWSSSNVTIGFDLGHDFDLEFSRSIMKLPHLSRKWSNRHETKSKHIDWTPGLKCDIWFDLGHDLHLEFSRSNMELAISQPKMTLN